MSDYTVQATWSTKDALAAGSALKGISATELGTEFDAIATAISSKYDSGDLASTGQAQDLTLSTVLLAPSTLNDVLTDNAGVLGDLQAFTDPAADRLFGWDTSGGAAIGFTLGTGLSFSTTSIALESGLSAISQLAKTDGNIIVGNGSTWVAESGATARASLGLVIGTNVQAHDAGLDAIAALAVTDGNFIVGNGSTWVAESGATARDSLSLGTGDTPQFSAINLGHASDTTISRDGAGQLAVEGRPVYVNDNGAFTSSKITFSTSAPSGGSNGDIWFVYS